MSITDRESPLDKFLRSLPDPAMITDLQGSVVYVNDNLLQLVGVAREEAVGQSILYPWLLPQGCRDGLPWFNEGLPAGPKEGLREGPKIDGQSRRSP